MVWHAHMLNPRAYLEDCIRGAKLHLWGTPFPWQLIDKAIDNKSFDYQPGDEAKANFENKTRRAWENLDEAPEKALDCLRCGKQFTVPWTQGEMSASLNAAFEMSTGYADKNFMAVCMHCYYPHDHQTLRVARFRRDIEALFDNDQPLPGTFYDLNGIPAGDLNYWFPNRLALAGKQQLLRATDPRLEGDTRDMLKLRTLLESLMKDRNIMAEATGTRRTSLTKEQKVAFRRMMSHYWENSSMFGLDLVGAVIRQGTFVQKMDNLDWIHSPALSATMDRLIRKYTIFFQIMAQNPGHMAVPTLDVDLAWHTHQLSPSRYYEYSRAMTTTTFIDHDDKVDEGKLSDGFEWTSKEYKKLTDGEVYSGCTCWYCEATRESTLYRPFPFHSASTMRARTVAENLHDDPNISPDPERNPHISAHNAVRVQGVAQAGNLARFKEMRLRNNYQKAYRRAQKRREKESARNGASRNTAAMAPYDSYYYYPMVWGYPYYVPFYAPYMCDPCINPDVYTSNPACMNVGPAAYGNCAAGTCGGGVAAGACGGMGGACAGGCSGKSDFYSLFKKNCEAKSIFCRRRLWRRWRRVWRRRLWRWLRWWWMRHSGYMLDTSTCSSSLSSNLLALVLVDTTLHLQSFSRS
jgi:hypothetical protein